MPRSSQTPIKKHQPGKRGGGPHLPMPQRLERLSDRTGECWLWLGRKTNDGYGMITVDKRNCIAHRVSYETHVGPIPEGLQIDHLCRTRSCINPAHLEPVTAAENMARAAVYRSDSGAYKTECVAGHPFSEENTRWYRGWRYCKECHRRRTRETQARVRAAKPRVRGWTDHAKVASSLKAAPGEWMLVCEPSNADSAYHSVSWIRRGSRLRAYAPAGSFEAEVRTEGDTLQVYARFVGEAS